VRALITGGAGFIGSHIADTLIQQGHHVTIIDDLSTGRMANIDHLRAMPHFQFAIETIMNETVLDRLVSECDIIYHMAAAVGVELIVNRPVEVIERCVLGTDAVLRVANRYRKKVLLASTSEIYGKNTQVPFNEEADRILGSTTKSRWSYSCSKAIDEFLALAFHKERGLPIVIVRLFNTVGPRQTGQYGMVVPRFIEAALAEKPITVYGDGKQSRCFGHVTDIVGAIVELSRHSGAVGEIFNVGNEQEITILGLAEKVKQITGSNSEIVNVPYSEAYEAGFEDMTRRVPDLGKIKALIGFEPRIGIDEIIRQIADLHRSGKSTTLRS
jgi:UDP-glucose 4-epimerase